MICYLDCDTGIDDALAVALLLAAPGVDLAGVGTVSGNTGADQAARNTLDLLGLAGRDDVPVAVGARHPLGESFAGGSPGVHGDNGIGGVSLPTARRGPIDRDGADLLLDLARTHPGELRVIATGPLTNLAVALQREPALPGLVHDLTVMGGAVRVPGNRGPAEANFADDPRAVTAVLDAGWPVTLVPLDVTRQHTFGPADQTALRGAGTSLTVALADMLTAYLDFYEGSSGVRRVPLHDPLAAGIAVGLLQPDDAPLLGLRVDKDGHAIEDSAARTRTRVVLSLIADGAPVIRTLICGAVTPPGASG